jgi:hypothetical protein
MFSLNKKIVVFYVVADRSFHAIGTRTVKSTHPRGGITVSIFL